jgi:hypothetical protein
MGRHTHNTYTRNGATREKCPYTVGWEDVLRHQLTFGPVISRQLHLEKCFVHYNPGNSMVVPTEEPNDVLSIAASTPLMRPRKRSC